MWVLRTTARFLSDLSGLYRDLDLEFQVGLVWLAIQVLFLLYLGLR
jgi:hypothetical protein